MQLNEHLSKCVLAELGVPCGEGVLASDPDTAASAAARLGFPVAVKAQLPASGRGKAGGILRADDEDGVRAGFAQVLGLRLGGLTPASVRIEPWETPDFETYLAVSFSETHRRPVVLFNRAGGVDVEHSGSTRVVPLRRDGSLDAAALMRAAMDGELGHATARSLHELAGALIRAYHALDACLLELNPVGHFTYGVRALDARVIVDDAALFRQDRVARAVRATTPRPIEELEREHSRLEYVPLEGAIGLVSGGAGMALAAMDIIASHGAAAACFLDASANPTADGYRRALQLLEDADQVSSVLVSVFGGLTRVDKVAENLCALLAEGVCTKPVVFRLMGTHAERATETLAKHGHENHPTLEAAVVSAVAAAGTSADSTVLTPGATGWPA